MKSYNEFLNKIDNVMMKEYGLVAEKISDNLTGYYKDNMSDMEFDAAVELCISDLLADCEKDW